VIILRVIQFSATADITKKRKILQKEITTENVTLTEAGEFQNDLLPVSLIEANSQDIHPRYASHLAKRTIICSLRISKYDSSYLREGHIFHCIFHAANALKFLLF
jgi:hypothetical protein